MDEFHIGGRAATKHFLDQLDLQPDHHVLDVGCGLGGASRFAAHAYECRVTGVDLTEEYVETGNALCGWFACGERIHLEVGDATALPHANDTFDRAYMMHVGMNIADKAALAAELHRVLRPGAKVGIYDIMRVGEGDLAFPVPWATTPEGSSVASPAAYKAALESAGLRVLTEQSRRDFALTFFDQLQAQTTRAEGPPPLGLHILMGKSAPAKLKNMIEDIACGRIAPVEIVAEKPA